MRHMIVNDETAAAAFASVSTRAIIFELMKRESSLSELRDTLGMSLTLLHYHVTRLQRLGLIAVSAVRRRGGRPIKSYRAAASEFHVPGSVGGRTAGTGLREELEAALERSELRHPTETCYYLDGEGSPRMRRSRSAGRDATHQRWWRIHLSQSAAANLSQELSDLVAKYEPADGSGAQAYICHFALVKT
jgi:DNA-binding transcriptional ArsR family regulator